MKIRREVAGSEKPEKSKMVALEINGLQQEVRRCFHQGDNYEVGTEEASKKGFPSTSVDVAIKGIKLVSRRRGMPQW
jgi:hypothetical protein